MYYLGGGGDCYYREVITLQLVAFRSAPSKYRAVIHILNAQELEALNLTPTT